MRGVAVLPAAAAAPDATPLRQHLVAHRKPPGLFATPSRSCEGGGFGTAVASLGLLVAQRTSRTGRWPAKGASQAARVARRAGQVVRVNPEVRLERTIRNATVKDFHSLLEEEGLQLMLAGAQLREPAEEEGMEYCYLPPLEPPFPGISKTQVRMTCSISLPRPGLAILKMHEFANLIHDESTDTMEFDETYSTRGTIKAEMTNILSFRQTGADLSVVYQVKTTSASQLPDWFSIPMDAFSPFINGFVSQAMQGSATEVLDVIEKRCKQRA